MTMMVGTRFTWKASQYYQGLLSRFYREEGNGFIRQTAFLLYLEEFGKNKLVSSHRATKHPQTAGLPFERSKALSVAVSGE